MLAGDRWHRYSDGMSGGGGSGSGGGFGRDGGLDCAAISFDAFLSSVNPEALSNASVGEILGVQLRDDPRSLVVIDRDGEVLGAITRKVRELLRCIQQQVKYQATIKYIHDGDVEVHIEPV